MSSWTQLSLCALVCVCVCVCVEGLLTQHKTILEHQLDILQFNSILTLSKQKEHLIPHIEVLL